MSTSHVIAQNLKTNLKHYSLYVFALILSVALYFAFVTLQYDPAMDEAEGSIKGTAALRAATVLLIAIVTVFNLYANNMFIRRRSREIGLLQLIGMTKSRIFRILSIENMTLYFGSLLAGAFVGFAFSKLALIILFKLTGVDTGAKLTFSPQAFGQTILVFSAVYVLIMAMNYSFIRRQTILSLFRNQSSTEAKVKPMSLAEACMGVLGLTLIIVGYYISSRLFSGDFVTMLELYGAMVFILASVIVGTYFFYKGSVRLILNIIRRRKAGYLHVREVLSLTTIMFRMKSHAVLLTVITTVSALAIGLLSLSYISYYSAEQTALKNVPAHFTFGQVEDAEKFKQALSERGMSFTEKQQPVFQATVDIRDVLAGTIDGMPIDPAHTQVAVVSEKALEGLDLAPSEIRFAGYDDLMQKFIPLRDEGTVTFHGTQTSLELAYKGMERSSVISWFFTKTGPFTAIVDDDVFQQLMADQRPELQLESLTYSGIDLVDADQLASANQVYRELGFHNSLMNDSRLDMSVEQKKRMGLLMFIVGFLGLTFLVTSGSILYFKQMDESQDEKPSYTILRKLGYTPKDLLSGIRIKQWISFGIPLVVGMVHGYFAVQSGWFLFGTELWTPMVLIMAIYAVLYSIYGVLSVQHYKKVIRGSL